MLKGVEANRIYELSEKEAGPAPVASPLKAVDSTFFADASDRIQHTHHDEPFDDYARQPLLPRKLSQAGPGVAWVDLDGDGWEDLVVSAGRGGRTGVIAAATNDLLALRRGSAK